MYKSNNVGDSTEPRGNLANMTKTCSLSFHVYIYIHTKALNEYSPLFKIHCYWDLGTHAGSCIQTFGLYVHTD